MLKKITISVLLFIIIFWNIDKVFQANIPDFAQEYNGHKYVVYDAEEIIHWEEASKKIKKVFGGYMAVINSEEENNFLYELCLRTNVHNCYFGLKRSEESWEWINNDDFSYSNWADGEPNNDLGIENYGMFFQDYQYQWNDGNGYGRYFIVEWNRFRIFLSPIVKLKLEIKEMIGNMIGSIGNMISNIGQIILYIIAIFFIISIPIGFFNEGIKNSENVPKNVVYVKERDGFILHEYKELHHYVLSLYKDLYGEEYEYIPMFDHYKRKSDNKIFVEDKNR